MNGVSGATGVCVQPQERTGVIAGTVKTAAIGALGAVGAAAYDCFSASYALKTESSGFFANLKQIFSEGLIWKNIGKSAAKAAGVVGGLYLAYRGIKGLFSSDEAA